MLVDGASIRTREIGSHTRAPARWRACIRTSGVSFRKSAAVLVGPRRDDLLLHFAVERDGQLAGLVGAHVDQRILLHELGQRSSQRDVILVAIRRDPGFERRRREVMWLRVAATSADRLTDLDLGETPQLADLTGSYGVPAHPRATFEDADPGDLVGSVRL